MSSIDSNLETLRDLRGGLVHVHSLDGERLDPPRTLILDDASESGVTLRGPSGPTIRAESARIDAPETDAERETLWVEWAATCGEPTWTAGQYGELTDYRTGDVLRPATPSELHSSRTAAETDGGAGVIDVDGRSCFVV